MSVRCVLLHHYERTPCRRSSGPAPTPKHTRGASPIRQPSGLRPPWRSTGMSLRRPCLTARTPPTTDGSAAAGSTPAGMPSTATSQPAMASGWPLSMTAQSPAWWRPSRMHDFSMRCRPSRAACAASVSRLVTALCSTCRWCRRRSSRCLRPRASELCTQWSLVGSRRTSLRFASTMLLPRSCSRRRVASSLVASWNTSRYSTEPLSSPSTSLTHR